jgi:hypothetical protein
VPQNPCIKKRESRCTESNSTQSETPENLKKFVRRAVRGRKSLDRNVKNDFPEESKYRTKGLKSIRERGFMEDERNVRKPMNQYNALKQALKPHLGWHGARLSFLALFLLALLKVKTS